MQHTVSKEVEPTGVFVQVCRVVGNVCNRVCLSAGSPLGFTKYEATAE